MLVERELKYALSAQGYRAVRDHALETKAMLGEAEQINTYLDTPDAQLAAHRITLRVRERQGRFELTCKRQRSHEGIGQHCDEINVDLEPAHARALMRSPNALIASALAPVEAAREFASAEGVRIDALEVLGSLTTLRARIALGGLVLELDRSRYLGAEDFEVECETDALSDAQRVLEAHLSALGVAFELGAQPKFARLMARRDALGR